MNKNIRNEYVPDCATSPGLVLEDYMEDAGLGIKELSEKSGLSESLLIGILNASEPVTDEIATALERVFDRPAYLWTGMEELYRKDLARLRKKRGGARPGAGRKANPRHRYSISLPGDLGRELDARAAAAGVTPYRWIVNELTLRLREEPV